MMQILTSCVCRLGEDDPLLFWLPLTWAKALTKQQKTIIILMFQFALNSPCFLCFFFASVWMFTLCKAVTYIWHTSRFLFCFSGGGGGTRSWEWLRAFSHKPTIALQAGQQVIYQSFSFWLWHFCLFGCFRVCLPLMLVPPWYLA